MAGRKSSEKTLERLYSEAVAVNTVLDDSNVPEGQRQSVISLYNKYNLGMLGLGQIARAFAEGRNEKAIETMAGFLGEKSIGGSPYSSPKSKRSPAHCATSGLGRQTSYRPSSVKGSS